MCNAYEQLSGLEEKVQIVHISVPFHRLSLTNRHIQRIIGYQDEEAPEPFPQMIAKGMEKAKQLSTIQAGYVLVKEIDSIKETNSIILHDVLGHELSFSVDKIVFGQLKRAVKMLVFVCTAGKSISDHAKQLMADGDLLNGYVMDVIGSEIVEAAMDLLQDSLEKQFALKGMNITNRYSPGYCHWSVADQQKLFRLLPQGFCGITLTPSSLMQPAKSISGFIGVGKNVRRSAYKCSVCDSQDCIYRSLKTKSP